MGTTHLLFGIHCHQPVDNFHNVVHEAIEKSYRPFFEHVELFANFRFAVHFSGWLLEFIREHDAPLFALMQKLAASGRIEFFTGGFYEPILSVIPSKDRIEQVRKLSSYIKKYFGQTPRGLWLTERVWDSALVGDMAKCGVEYMLVDDYHFVSTGFAEEELFGYYLTEEGGEKMALFPINKTLRYMIPFKEVEGVASHLATLSAKEDKAAVIFDDGEKFGIWPKTHEWVYEQGWLERFLGRLDESAHINATTFADYFDTHTPLGLAYLPPYSYYEMGEWSLNAKDAIRLEHIKAALTEFSEDELNKYVKGSIWKNFLVKYYESNHIHKRILELSKARSGLKDKTFDEWLFKAQTNDVLWHGVFGGLYLPNLRDNAYRFIIEAENVRYGGETGMEVYDVNMDGHADAKYVGTSYIAVIDTKQGAQLCELDLRDRCFNLQNTLTRYEEAYHDKIMTPRENPKSKHSDGIDTIHNLSIENIALYREKLVFDWYRKNSFVDHICGKELDADAFGACRFAEYGDFANQPFVLKEEGERSLLFERAGGVYVDGAKYDTHLTKRYTFDESGLIADITLESGHGAPLSYVLEFNLHFADLSAVRCNGTVMEDTSMTLSGDTLELADPYTAKTFSLSVEGASEILLARIDSVSQSEIGFDLTNQGIAIAFVVSYKNRLDLRATLSVESGE